MNTNLYGVTALDVARLRQDELLADARLTQEGQRARASMGGRHGFALTLGRYTLSLKIVR